LVLYLSRNDYELNLTSRTLDLLRHPDDLGCFILDQFSIGSRTVIDQSDLHEILSEYLDDRARIEKRMARFLATELFSDLNESFAQFLGNSSAVCFAKSSTNFLMWSHYASGHAGVCLEFEVDVEDANSGVGRFPLVSPWLHDGKRLAWKENVKAVRYTNSLARASFYDLLAAFDNEGDVDLMNLSKSHWRSFADRIEPLFLQKLEPWHEEEEWRIVHVGFQEETPERRLLTFDDQALTGILFGAKTPQTIRSRVQDIFEPSEDKPVFYRCSVDGTRGVVPRKLDDSE